MLGAAKENNLRSISDRISSTMKRFLLEDLRWRNVRCIKSKIYAGCWNFKTLKVSLARAILNSIREETGSQ